MNVPKLLLHMRGAPESLLLAAQPVVPTGTVTVAETMSDKAAPVMVNLRAIFTVT